MMTQFVLDCIRKRILLLLVVVTALPLSAQRVGVSLSGGAALGYAHLGFLQAMDEAGMKPDYVTGTSMGAIIGLMYSAGYTPQQILQIVHEEHMDRALRLVRPSLGAKGGVSSTRHLQRVLLKYVPHNCFDSLPIAFSCCVSDMNHYVPRYIDSGNDLVQYVMASAAMPGVFAPVCIDSVYYFDGGAHDNLPVKPLLDAGCDVRIGVRLLIEQPHTPPSAKDLWLHFYSYCTYQTAYFTMDDFTDVVTIDPQGFWLMDFSHADDLFQIGYEAGKTYFATHSR